MYNINKYVKKEENKNNIVEKQKERERERNRKRERENKPSEERLIKFDGDR